MKLHQPHFNPAPQGLAPGSFPGQGAGGAGSPGRVSQLAEPGTRHSGLIVGKAAVKRGRGGATPPPRASSCSARKGSCQRAGPRVEGGQEKEGESREGGWGEEPGREEGRGEEGGEKRRDGKEGGGEGEEDGGEREGRKGKRGTERRERRGEKEGRGGRREREKGGGEGRGRQGECL